MQSKTAFFKRRSSINTKLLFFCVLSVILIYTDARFNYLETIRTGVTIAIHPLRALALLPSSLMQSINDNLITTANLREENVALKEEVFNSRKLLLVQKSLRVENENLRRLLDLRAKVDPGQLVAEIIYHPRDPFFKEVVVDKGSTHGVSLGSPVIDAAGLVGQVIRLHPWVSEIALVTNRDHPVPVQVARNGMRAIVFGVGYDTKLEVRFMPIDTDIKEGDVLATSGIGGIYPSNLPVGIVTEVTRDESYPYAKILVEPVAKIGSHRQLLLLSQNEQLPEQPSNFNRDRNIDN